MYAQDPTVGGKSMIALQDPAEHARRRKPWNRSFNIEALKGYEEIIETRATQLLDQLAKQDGVVDLAKWFSYFTYIVFLSVSECKQQYSFTLQCMIRYDFMSDMA